MNLLHHFSSIFRRASTAHLRSGMVEGAMRSRLENLPLQMTRRGVTTIDEPQDYDEREIIAEGEPPPRPAAQEAAMPRYAAASEPDALPVIYQRPGARASLLKAGQQQSQWHNPFISHAMPAVLQLQRILENTPKSQAQLRAQLGMELKLYRERLAGAGCEWQQAQDASYLLCTYLDEVCNDAARHAGLQSYDGERSLLVEFHGDAWGGEDAFSDLERWVRHEPLPTDLLALYELALALGWQGRYRVLERGDALLQDLRSQLHATIWRQREPEALGGELAAPPPAPAAEPPSAASRRWLTPMRGGAIALSVVALAYGAASIGLDVQGRPIREALAAWTPPLRTINLATTLPSPLPQLLSEGWLVAYKHPQGWLLVFRSDGAFDVGKANVRASFQKNIERLGLAFAPWPGDLEVIGHTDRQPIQTSEFPSNQQLSEARARSVADMLRQTAIPGGAHAPDNAVARRIESSGRGDNAPLDPAKTPAAYERNRRVDVLWKVVDTARSPDARPAAQPDPLDLASGVSIGDTAGPLNPAYKERQP
ncbi:type IVB secretion system protein IcmH/DotU [Chromobacterium vaccinii]|uniref:type IVB secretion system protein IcmH/DotU n=1 Tax=Chromobacterium vaccinii TaxID=1108595 RepID=UPI003C7550FA